MAKGDLQLGRLWKLGDRLGGGGFGEVYQAEGSAGEAAVAKLIPTLPGAERELSLDRLAGARNVVPILDSGATPTHFAIIMPRASRSLETEMTANGGKLLEPEACAILADVALALLDLAERQVVHRDIKPANVLRLEDAWCLADFGIARYADQTTATNTWKMMGSSPYVAPERWRTERATSASDVYSVGVMAFELLTGAPPFGGPQPEDYAEQHLHQPPPGLPAVSPLLASLVAECLLKAPAARPTPANILARLQAMPSPASPGAARLQETNRKAADLRAAEAATHAAAQTDEARRAVLAADASRVLTRIAEDLRSAIVTNAPLAVGEPNRSGGWVVRLGSATLTFNPPIASGRGGWDGREPVFDLVAHASLSVRIPCDRHDYEGPCQDVWKSSLPCGHDVVLIRLPWAPPPGEPGVRRGPRPGTSLRPGATS